MSKDDTDKTMLWEENSCESSQDSFDCFLGLDSGSSNSSEFCIEGVGSESSDEAAAAEYAQVGEMVVEKMTTLLKSSDFVKLRQEDDQEVRQKLARVNHSEIELGKLLGGGGFSNVFEIKNCLSNDLSVDPCKCAVKVLRKRVIKKPKLFAACAVGLLREGSILASLNHENIVSVRGFSQTGPSSYATGRNDACFVILERLEEMLSCRMEAWKDSEANKVLMFDLHKNHKAHMFLSERLQVALQLANAIAYLHKRSIVHRDIKPNNVGFDSLGTLKLFDFDVSKILPEETYEDQVFRLTKTGTKRYMSPECGLGKPYNRKTDVYSFAILLHQMVSLELPFEEMDMFEIKRRVFVQGVRPKIQKSWPCGIKRLFKQAWSPDICARPTMANVCSILSCEIENLVQEPSLKAMFGFKTSKFSWVMAQ
eukprot:scaffold22748_cov182-Cylindrotheca_fusiformis.AAC.11